MLGEDVFADADDPPFDRSAMDGVAYRGIDHPGPGTTLRLVGTIAAGDAPTKTSLKKGEAMAIMTGAPLPAGADQVMPVEEIRREEDGVVLTVAGRMGSHIRVQGEGVRKGERVLSAGEYLSAERVGVLATVGASLVRVYSKPRVALAPTGDELVSVEEIPRPGQIRDSNRWALAAAVSEWGGEVRHIEALGDSKEAVRSGIADGLRSDILVLTGGVSMGEFDFVDTCLREAGVETLFHKVAIKPGKPVYVGRRGSAWIFGLPGNPVSAMVTARLFLRTVIGKMQGVSHPAPTKMNIALQGDLKPTGHRSTFVPGRLTVSDGELWVEPIETKGSGDAVHHAQSDGLILRRKGANAVSTGDRVEVWLNEPLLRR